MSHAGVLYKRGYALPPHWRPRHFALSGRSLVYFQSATEARQPGCVAKVAVFLEAGLVVETPASPHPYEFLVRDPSTGGAVRFASDTEDERDAWVEALRGVIGVVGDDEPRVLPVQQLAGEIDGVLATIREHVVRDRWLLAQRTLSSVEQSIAAAAADTASSRAVAAVRASLAADAPLLEKVRSTAEWARDALAQFESNEGWTLVQDGATKVSYRSVPGKPFNSLRVDTVVNSDLVSLAAVIAEADLSTEWVPFCNRAAMIAKPTHMHGYANLFFEFPFFIPLSNREAMLEGRGVDMMDRNALLVMLRSVEAGPNEHCEIPAEMPSHTRVDATGGFHISLLGPSSVRFRIILNVDLKVPLLRPAIVNTLNQKFGGLIMVFIRKVVARFKGSQYETRVQQNREFYGDVEDRIRHALAAEAGGIQPVATQAMAAQRTPMAAPRRRKIAVWFIAALVLLIGVLVVSRFDAALAHWHEVAGTQRESALVALVAGAFGMGLLVAGASSY